MFIHNKKLQYTVRVARPNPVLASFMLEQFGGPQGELAAAMRYFTQALGEVDPGRKDMLMDIATEELSHLEIIGSVVAMLNKGGKGQLAEGADEQASLFRSLSQGCSVQTEALLYGGGPSLTNSAGAPWTAAYIDTIGEPTADLRSNIAAESRAKIVYERLIAVTDDPDVKDTLGFLMTREIAHQKSFESALYAIHDNFPPGKLAGKAEFANLYVHASHGDGETRGPWNSGGDWRRIDDVENALPLDGGNGEAQVKLSSDEDKFIAAFIKRTRSDPEAQPLTTQDINSGRH
jgi:Mn-containing catalase